MACNFIARERDQLYLLPPSVADWLPEDHLAFFILDAVEEMDLSPFYGVYRHDGRGAQRITLRRWWRSWSARTVWACARLARSSAFATSTSRSG
jgi:hypothetical protein